MDHFQGLRNGHSTFLLSEAVQPLQHSLDLSLLAASLRISLHYVQLPWIEVYDILTKPALFNLLGSEGKHGE